MRHNIARLFLVGLSVICLAPTALVADGKSREEAKALLADAQQRCDFRSATSPPFRMRGRTKISPLVVAGERAAQGIYVEVWASPRGWQREEHFGGATILVRQRDGTTSISGDFQFNAWYRFLLSEAMDLV